MARHASPRRYPRTARVNEVVHETIAEELERLSDPRLELVTVTGVEVSPDLRHATVYYSDRTDAVHEQTRAALRSAASHLRAELGRQVRLKYVPELTFRADPAIEQGERIEEIIRELHRRGPGGRERR
jgi:ribosome-binding factor A